LIKLKST